MRWTPLKKFFAGTAAVLAAGLGYLAFRKPKTKPKPGIQATPATPQRPESTPATPAAPRGPEGISPFAGAAPRNWQATFNDGVMAAIEDGRTREQIRNCEDMQYFVAQSLFPGYTWPPANQAQAWQKKVWQEIRGILFQLSDAQSWPFSGTRETIDAAITLWLSGARNVQHCMQLGLGDALTIRTCAAQRTFPDASWPPEPSSPAWQRAAWERIVISL